MRAKWLAFLLSRLFDRARSGRRYCRDTTFLPRCMVEASASFWPRSQTILVSRKWSFTSPTRRAPVQPARPTTCSRKARTSPATGAPGNGGLALLGSAWQASLLRRTGLLNTNSRPCDTNSLFQIRLQIHKNCSNNQAFQATVADRSPRTCQTHTLLRLRL
jgi:hypothetical protein